METSHGNHFGFYEGDICAAFSNTDSYTYPPKVALAFLDQIFREQNQQNRFGNTFANVTDAEFIFFKNLETPNDSCDLELVTLADFS